MFNDRSEALRRLEEALLEEEEYDTPAADAPEDEELLTEDILDELLEDTAPARGSVAYQNFSNAYGAAYNSDRTDVDLEEYCRQVQKPKKDRFGWLIVVCLLLILILGAIVVVFLRRGGFL